MSELKKELKQRLHFGRLQEAVSVRREMYADIPEGTSFETILEPDYWVHYARDLRPMDKIEVFCEDGSWEGTLRVMFVSTTDIKMNVISKVEYDVEEEVSETDTHEIVWKGPVVKYAVIRKDTKVVLKDHLYPKEKAYEELRSHIKQVGA